MPSFHQPPHVGRVAAGGEVVEHIGVGADPEEADDVLRRLAVEEVVHGLTIGAGQLSPQQPEDGRRDVDQTARPVQHPVPADAGSRHDEGRPRLDHVERPVLAPVPAGVLPVVRRGARRRGRGRRGGRRAAPPSRRRRGRRWPPVTGAGRRAPPPRRRSGRRLGRRWGSAARPPRPRSSRRRPARSGRARRRHGPRRCRAPARAPRARRSAPAPHRAGRRARGPGCRSRAQTGTAAGGDDGVLDVPLDTTTPVARAGPANQVLADLIGPALAAALPRGG